MPTRLEYHRRLFALYRSYRRRDAAPDARPVRLWIELSSECNLQCVMCPNRDLPDGQRGAMAPALFRRIIDEVKAYAFEATLHHRGESLLHPRAAELIGYAARAGLSTKLHTNGVLLGDSMAREIVDSGLDRISVSFDGFTADAYEKIRRGAGFEHVVGNIRNLLIRRNALKKRRPVVAIEAIRLPATPVDGDELRRFRGLFAGLHLDQLIVKEPHNWAGYLPRRESGGRHRPCTFPWNALVILWNGDVTPCPQDFFATETVGNAARDRIEDVWRGERLRRLRRAQAGGRVSDFPACSQCDRPWRKTFLGIPREYLRKAIFRKMP